MSEDITHTLRHLENLASMCEPGFGMGSEPFRLAREEIIQLRGENARMKKALARIANWRIDCHDHDLDAGYPLRDFDVDDVAGIEGIAQRALAPHTSKADSGSSA